MADNTDQPTTKKHGELADTLMPGLGFQWSAKERAWVAPAEPITQQQAAAAVRKVLEAAQE